MSWNQREFLTGVSKQWRALVTSPALNEHLQHALDKTAPDYNDLCPLPQNIFASMRFSPYYKTRIIIVGQDPYYNMRENDFGELVPVAEGLSFSCSHKLQPSVKGIYTALVQSGVIDSMPTTGDLTMWAVQGVLLLNRALTTVSGRANAHIKHWKPFTNALVAKLSARKQQEGTPLVFMLWGAKAQELVPLISDYHTILQWCHPSPLAKSAIPRNKWFEHCDHFTHPLTCTIDWNPERRVIIYTDGASTVKSSPNYGGWAFYVDAGEYEDYVRYGKVPTGTDTDGTPLHCTNQRAEGTALIHAYEFIIRSRIKHPITIVTDSKFYINLLTDWMHAWHRTSPTFARKNNGDPIKNRDIVRRIYDAYTRANVQTQITLQHVVSHRTQPPDISSIEYRIWYGNYVADLYASKHHELPDYDTKEEYYE